MQTTIINPSSCYGIGVHSGRKTQLTIKPAPVDTGIVFIRKDVSNLDNYIPAIYSNVSDTFFSTTISNDANVKISTIEHLMAALYGCGIDNVFVEVDGPEVPIMDGSSKAFVFMINCAGVKILNKPRKFLQLIKEIKVEDNGAEIIAIPSKSLEINLTIDFASKAIGKQKYKMTNLSQFNKDIANARTFGFTHELDYMQSKGLAKGASLKNAIGIDADHQILNEEGLRYDNEFARHKTLDQIGDIFTAGSNIICSLNSYKAGHGLNNKLLRKIFDTPDAYQFKIYP